MYTREGLSREFKYPFSGRATGIVNLAEKEAKGFNHNYIGTEHLLLGLTGDKTLPLISLGINSTNVRTSILFAAGRGDMGLTGEIVFTPRARKVIGLGIGEAKKHSDLLLPEHLLLGLSRDREGIAAGILENLGVSGEELEYQARLSCMGEPIARGLKSLARLRAFFVDPNQDAAKKTWISIILDETLGLTSTQTGEKNSLKS